MKHIFFCILICIVSAASAQTDSIPNLPTPSAIVGQVNFNSYSVFDSLQKPVLRYISTGKDTVQVAWGVVFTYCEKCVGERIFARSVRLIAPGVNTTLYAVPTTNDNPSYDEAWETTAGQGSILYLSVDATGLPTSIYLTQKNGYSLKWSSPKPPPAQTKN